VGIPLGRAVGSGKGTTEGGGVGMIVGSGVGPKKQRCKRKHNKRGEIYD
jgi:hypothetical protein